jgi:ABC-type bacteriocin/lantibiotic exporter with double-glycine peptidase domain
MNKSIENQARWYAIKVLLGYLVPIVLFGIFAYIDAKLLLIALTVVLVGFICAGIYRDYYNEKLEELKSEHKGQRS